MYTARHFGALIPESFFPRLFVHSLLLLYLTALTFTELKDFCFLFCNLWLSTNAKGFATHSLAPPHPHTQSANAKGFDGCVTFSTDVSSLWGPMTPLAGMCSYRCSY